MPDARVTATGVLVLDRAGERPMAADEILVHRPCQSIWPTAAVTHTFALGRAGRVCEDDAFWSPNYERPNCPTCHQDARQHGLGAHFYVVADGQQPAANLSDRWGEDAARAWTAIPHALSRHLPALGLDAADVGVMVAILSHDGPRGLYPSLATIGGHVGVDRGHIRARVNMWVRRGLWEKTARHEATGARTSDRLTYNGLAQAVELIATNERSGSDPHEGLPALLARLERQAAARPAPTRDAPQPDPSDANVPARSDANAPAPSDGGIPTPRTPTSPKQEPTNTEPNEPEPLELERKRRARERGSTNARTATA